MKSLCVRKGLWFAFIATAVLALASGMWLLGQQNSPASQAAPVVRVTTRLVMVDVVVTDKRGHSVTDLTRDDFILLERGKPQAISIFGFEQPGTAAKNLPAPPPLPLHVFTNRPEYRWPTGPPTFLLLDGLNTAPGDQSSSREQLLHYLATQLQPGQPVAILALTDRLQVLQDFTSDPAMLRAALEKFTSKKSVQMVRGEPWQVTSLQAQRMTAEMLAAIDRFNQGNYVDSTGDRVRITLAALRSIARIAAGFSGRKNLLWVSAGFPFTFLPGQDATSGPPASFVDEIRRTTTQLTEAQVAVYPVDARGLVATTDTRGITDQLVDTIQQPAAPDGGQIEPSHKIENISTSNMAMEEIAADTGGLAIINHNDLSKAVAMSLADGSSYYSLGYYPADETPDGKFRKIEVRAARKGMKLRYRRGYFALEPLKAAGEDPEKLEKHVSGEVMTALADPLPDTAVTFRAYIPPPKPAPRAEVEVQFLVDTPSVLFKALQDGRQQCNLEFVVAAVTPEGMLVNIMGKTIDARFQPDVFARLKQSNLPFNLTIELEPGNYQLRLAVRDNQSGWIGTLDLPLALPKP